MNHYIYVCTLAIDIFDVNDPVQAAIQAAKWARDPDCLLPIVTVRERDTLTGLLLEPPWEIDVAEHADAFAASPSFLESVET